MYTNDRDFGIQIKGETIGEAWLSMVEAILKKGEAGFDEGRRRRALQNIRLKVSKQESDDSILNEYANKNCIEHMKKLVFESHEMFDFDIIPSFSPGAKSYHQRMVEGKMMDFVVKRLSYIPESKKAVIVFPTYEDYKQVLSNQKDDYLPCLVTFQTRLLGKENYYLQNNIFFMRSCDAFQKAPGNLVTMAMLSEKIAERLTKNLKKKVKLGSLDGLITDAHIYEETIKDAEAAVSAAKRN
ncbi:MAG: hypothetical protein KKA79_07245 [Nanoarchaeota archaeon]|nr:hypothetical protein [Nanoarchaeota archaeon]